MSISNATASGDAMLSDVPAEIRNLPTDPEFSNYTEQPRKLSAASPLDALMARFLANERAASVTVVDPSTTVTTNLWLRYAADVVAFRTRFSDAQLARMEAYSLSLPDEE